MRSYIRHPSDIPIKVVAASPEAANNKPLLTNVSHGGLSFITQAPVQVGVCIRLKIDSVTPIFEVEGLVTYCNQEQGHFVIGIEFIRKDDLFVARMVEQICHIEHYKREMAAQQGRVLTGEEAAREWIQKYAAKFPRWSA